MILFHTTTVGHSQLGTETTMRTLVQTVRIHTQELGGMLLVMLLTLTANGEQRDYDAPEWRTVSNGEPLTFTEMKIRRVDDS